MAYIIYICAFFGITASAFSNFLVQPRILMKYAQDGLFFEIFKKTDPITMIPVKGGWITGITICIICFFLDLEPIAKVISLGSLVPYSFVNLSMLSLRFRKTDKFRQYDVFPTAYSDKVDRLLFVYMFCAFMFAFSVNN